MLTILMITLVLFLLYLAGERFRINRMIQKIPLRIAVTGTRGKSGLVRLTASMLRQSGKRTIGKTTGSEALFLLPDGHEAAVIRRGPSSIIEQKKLLNRAVKERAECLVAEIMSIRPENHFVESRQLLQPQIVVITNIRRDHYAAWGENEDEIASMFALTVTQGAKVFVPETECRPHLVEAVRLAGGDLIVVKKGDSLPLLKAAPELEKRHFLENLDLAWALARCLHLQANDVAAGMARAGADIGSLRIWKLHLEKGEKTVYFVNGFAANDPYSTKRVIEKTGSLLPGNEKPVGLLSLRFDRPDRTAQWVAALKQDGRDWFERLYVIGGHAHVLHRKITSARKLSGRSPEGLLKQIVAEVKDRSVILGCGNIKGIGAGLVRYCLKKGEEHGL